MLKQIKQIAIHGIIWIFIFFLNYLVISSYPVTFKPVFHIQIWSVYLIVFYLNLLVLLPLYFFKKKFLLYTIFSLALIAGGNYTTVEIRKMHFSRLELERSQRAERTESSGESELRPERPPRDVDKIRSSTSRARHYSRRNIIFSLTGIMLIFTLSFAYGMLGRYQENEKIRLQTEKEKIETELSSLKQQVNPHFLFNSLNSIYSLANRKSEKTTEAILKLSEMLRYMIYDTEKSVVPLKQEFSGLLSFIELQKLRLTGKTKLLIDIRTPDEDYMIEPLLLLPVLENAFKYGSDNLNDSVITISASAADEKLTFFCSNTIIQGLIKQNTSDTSGIGLKNVKRRLEILYPYNHDFTYKEKDGIFNVYLSLMLRK